MMSKTWPVGTAAYAAPRSYFPAPAVFGEMVRRFQRWRAERQTVAALSQLESHVLEDIGVERSEIPHVARRLAEQS